MQRPKIHHWRLWAIAAASPHVLKSIFWKQLSFWLHQHSWHSRPKFLSPDKGGVQCFQAASFQHFWPEMAQSTRLAFGFTAKLWDVGLLCGQREEGNTGWLLRRGKTALGSDVIDFSLNQAAHQEQITQPTTLPTTLQHKDMAKLNQFPMNLLVLINPFLLGGSQVFMLMPWEGRGQKCFSQLRVGLLMMVNAHSWAGSAAGSPLGLLAGKQLWHQSSWSCGCRGFAR